MRATLGKLERAAAKQDVDAYLALRWEFYGTCYRASGRRRLVEEVERLYWRSERYNRLVLSTAQRFQESLGRYSAFFADCEADDGLAAERDVQDSLRWAVDSAAAACRPKRTSRERRCRIYALRPATVPDESGTV